MPKSNISLSHQNEVDLIDARMPLIINITKLISKFIGYQ